ncbi:MAG: alanine--tRNA ligase [bacterium]|nr:alanine--tRNA ligase [bacterium]
MKKTTAQSKSPQDSTSGAGAPPSTESAAGEWTVARLRREWIDYFKSQDHTQTTSAGLIPAGDPTLLFTTAGMVQFKAYFAGTEKPPHPRTATIQKCVRTTDLEEVGKTDRHLTFFEMLGNFSFGDYFKREAIRFAWEFSLDRLKLDPEKIWVTVYEDDDEAEEIWHKEIGVPLERIRRLGKADNWWGPAGETGACGPCSELYWDRGPEYGGPDETGPGDDGDRFMEYWNLVFNQYHQDAQGQLHPLPQTGIDTGAGLERIVALLNEKDSVFDTDELAKVMSALEDLTPQLREDGQRIKYSAETKAPFRVITDHLRCVAFAISDGIFPGNTGRGYVIRRVLRRALLYARELGILQPVLYRLMPLIAEIYGPFYPAVQEKAEDIQNRIRIEEERFLRTLDQGLARFEDIIAEHEKQKAKNFSGDDAFTLYDTFGFPPEITIELAEKRGLKVDMDRFQVRMQEQQERAVNAGQWKTITLPPDMPAGKTDFVGYDAAANSAGDSSDQNNTSEGIEAQTIALLSEKDAAKDGEAKGGDQVLVSELGEGQSGIVVLDRTPFYAEGGGQLGDHGQLIGEDGAVFEVHDTQKNGAFFLHLGELKSGVLKNGEGVKASIDSERRRNLTNHHSATHLLNDALRKTLGDHIIQTGSLVSPDYLRFDFSHPQKLDDATVESVEATVNAAIAQAAPVLAEVLPIAEAKKKGAVATFGEKYGSEVRIVSMGEGGGLSLEFCGGCHVNNTEDIGLFHITRETSPGAGNRRIEAVTGDYVVRHFQDALDELQTKLAAHNDRVQAALADQKESSDAKAAGDFQECTVSTGDLPQSAAAALNAPGDVLQLHRTIESVRTALQKAEKRLIKLEKGLLNQKGDELLASVDETLAQAESIGEIRVVRKALRDLDSGGLRKFGDKLKEKSRGVLVLLGNTNEKGPSLLFMADKAATEAGADAGALIRIAAKILGGGGGGRPEMAQAGGKDASKMDEALQAARDAFAEKK